MIDGLEIIVYIIGVGGRRFFFGDLFIFGGGIGFDGFIEGLLL